MLSSERLKERNSCANNCNVMRCDAIERRQKAVKKEANRKSRKETQGCQCTRLSTNVDSTSYNLWNIIKLCYIS